MERKGFTLVELLVVIAIIALLMGILMPALSRVRQIAFRMVCGTNLSGIGKAMLIYANDYEDELPRAGGSTSEWKSKIPMWNAANRKLAYGLNNDGSGGEVTVTSSFYLLVKYSEVTPKSFLCKGDTVISEFQPDENSAGAQYDLISLWDFGQDPLEHCSYSYHLPYETQFALTTASEPGLAVAADPNPWKAGDSERDWELFDPDGDRDSVKEGNATTHQDEGQNVLFLDSHVEFEKVPFCAINEDNVYTPQSKNTDIRKGIDPGNARNTVKPMTRSDSVLVSEHQKKPRCFTADTLVWVDGKMVQISDVTPGQKVGTPGLMPTIVCSNAIEKVEAHDGIHECRDILLENGNLISVVDIHRFMLDSGQWISATNLKSGHNLKTVNGTVTVESVTIRPMPYVGKVYNLKVENGERYLVGQDGIVVRDW